MKLTGELKDKVDKTESMVEKKDIIAQAGMELTDDELEGVTGGTMEIKKMYVNNLQGAHPICPIHRDHELSGSTRGSIRGYVCARTGIHFDQDNDGNWYYKKYI